MLFSLSLIRTPRQIPALFYVFYTMYNVGNKESLSDASSVSSVSSVASWIQKLKRPFQNKTIGEKKRNESIESIEVILWYNLFSLYSKAMTHT